MILRCTRKLLAVLGPAAAGPAPAPDPEDWYANLVRFDRRTCLLLTHSATLFTIFEADVTASALRATRQLVTGLTGRELRREELPAGTFGDLGQQEVLLAKTADRSVLGGRNDMAFRCEYAIADAGASPLGFDLVLQINACHLGQAQQVDRHIRQFFPDVFATLAPRVKCFGDLPLEQAELQLDIGRVEPFGDFVLPGQSLC